MPENRKSNGPKNKNEPKDQRRKRQNRHPSGPIDKNLETEVIKSTAVEKSVVPSEPPPEFYKNLKRETDEILKITEDENSKYKKKEIQSNWAKYEMPIESYEEMDEQESIGADFETLIQASLSVGGHFQFKHEKSWDLTTGPSVYDKYFDIDMDKLSLGLSSIPFYERNNIEATLFTETDMLTMIQRAAKFKNKYYDKKYTAPDLGDNEFKEENKYEINEVVIDNNNINVEDKEIVEKAAKFKTEGLDMETVSNIILESPKDLGTNEIEEKVVVFVESLQEKKNDAEIVQSQVDKKLIKENVPEKATHNPVIESPEDLEKWLDDFLDD